MILCNEAVAIHCRNLEIPFIYRAHDAPSPEKLAMLTGLARSMGFSVPPHTPGPKAIQRLLEAAESSPAYYAIAMSALTSMPQAVYTPTSPKHFGLASDAYCHFTSPIRRYADLQAHRIIKEWLEASHSSTSTNEALQSISAQCSSTEREAESLERDVAQLKKVQFMLDQEGKIFEGMVSGITTWGVYVMLKNTTEGLIPSQNLKSHGYTHEKDKNRYANKRKRESLTIGTPISVRLTQANAEERKLTFALCNDI